MKTYLISFDDTDNLDTLGTGHALARFLGSLPYETGYITRHQLFVHERVPFTSHNSAMCATVSCDAPVREIADRAARFLREESAEGADPGLCLADAGDAAAAGPLVEWGLRAKTELLAKGEAYELAGRCGVHLSEHGGDGQGVVGALAAVGLRLSGNDGRVRGKAMVDAGQLDSGRTTVADLVALTGFDRVCTPGGDVLGRECIVHVDDGEVKAIYRDFQRTMLAEPCEGAYRLLGKRALKNY